MVSDERLTAEKEFYTSNTTGPNSIEREDLFKQYYEQQATVDKRNAKDTFRNFLIEQGMTSLNAEDMWQDYLFSLGYSGHVLGMERQYFIDNA
jgi:hypothetical protein